MSEEEIKTAPPPPKRRRRRRRIKKKKKVMDTQDQPESREEDITILNTLPVQEPPVNQEAQHAESEIEKLRTENEKMRAEFAEIRKQLREKTAPSQGSIAEIQAARNLLQQTEYAMGHKPKAEKVTPFHPRDIEDPSMGDKTPAVVEWYRDHAPEEFKRRYSGRKTHLEDRRGERPWEPLPGNVGPPSIPADPDGKFKIGDKEVDLSQTDDSGSAPRNTADV